MRKLGVSTLVLTGFIAGIAFVYSCGGGGSDVFAGGDADTLEGFSASAFALSSHSHSDYATTGLLASHIHTDYANSNHNHPGSDISSGTVPFNRLPVGSTSASVASGNHTHAAGDADTLDGLDSSALALSTHSHEELSSTYPGILKISPEIFLAGEDWDYSGYYLSQVSNVTPILNTCAPLTIPFDALLHGIEMKIDDNSTLGGIRLDLKSYDSVGGEITIATLSTDPDSAYGLTILNESINEPYYNADDKVFWFELSITPPTGKMPNYLKNIHLHWIKVYYASP